MLAAIKMEVMTPSTETPDEGSIGGVYIAWQNLYFCLGHYIFVVRFYLLGINIEPFSAIDFHMPPICSPLVRPGRPAEAEPVVSKQLSDTILRHVDCFSG